jgi:hypothetical protein
MLCGGESLNQGLFDPLEVVIEYAFSLRLDDYLSPDKL